MLIVNPTRVYGPGLLSESNGVTRMIKQYLEGRWRFIPGNGKSTGNYVHVEDVVSGHLLAMEKGKQENGMSLGEKTSPTINFLIYVRESGGVNSGSSRCPSG